ncbi:MAG: thiamine-phosphate kinase [Thiomicrospira sp.]|uniref:thiamine-phosphate kinase n=1 Tax=Thiomicrospira sp. TaxID=935 RepID=UPI0019FE117A|nr:thiamine-phosphate kinase [Thiomicrospira sp.]MBE0492973.1 thiamine-phosphate kinase [Thiomicrospira sp.]
MEFDLIEQYFKPLSQTTRPGDLAIGDDGALITPPENSQLVVVTDTLVSGVHFLAQANPYDIGWKSLAVNLSDLAAMGAQPAFYSLALTLPSADPPWLEAFSRGLHDCAKPYAMPLIGGDTTRGPLCISVTAQAWVPKGEALLRSRAKLGDDIYVSGAIGEAGLGLMLAKAGGLTSSTQEDYALTRLNRPQARVSLGLALRNLASSAIDVSDGLLADLNHILQASNLGAQLYLADIPLSDAVKNWAQANPIQALNAGDDYELCFTANPNQRQVIKDLSGLLGLPIHRIGKIRQAPGLVVEGLVGDKDVRGYEHF